MAFRGFRAGTATANNTTYSNDGSGTHAWQNVTIGGGGYQRGLEMHSDGSMASKTDVFGAYIGSTTIGEIWRMVATATSMPANYSESGTTNRFPVTSGSGVACIKFAPSDSDIMYMILDGYESALLVSQDKGLTWVDCAFSGTLPIQANGQYADYASGQICIDPADPNVVYVGTPTGLWRTLNGLSGNSATWTQLNSGTFGSGVSQPGIVGILADASSGTTSGRTNRVILGVNGKGIYYTADAGGSWTLVTSSTTTIGQAKMGVDGTYYATNIGGTGIGRVTTGNVYANIGPSQFTHSIACDPVDPSRLIALMGDGDLNIPLSAVNSGTPTWSGDWNNRGLFAAAGQPQWIVDSDDASTILTPGDIYFDPFTTTSTTSFTPGNGSITLTVTAGLPIAVGDCMRVYKTSNKAHFVEKFVTAYSGTSLTLAGSSTTASNSVSSAVGQRSFTVPSGLAFAVGSVITGYSAANNNNNFTGMVVSYSSTTLVIDITNNGAGASTNSDWVINQGASGGSGASTDWTLMKNRIWFAYGCGVLYTDFPIAPGRQTWNVQTTGMENMVANQLAWPPSGDPVCAFWDRPIWNLADPATPKAAYWPYNAPGSNNVMFGASVDYAKDDPTYVFGVYNFNNGGGYSNNKGVAGSWAHFASAIPGSSGAEGGGGTIAAITTNKLVVARGNPGNGIFQSQNRGASWAAVTGAPTAGWASTSAQIGGRRILCADEVTADVAYAYNTDAASIGLWITTDGGKSMSRVYTGAIVSGENDGYEAQLRAVPGQAGHLFFTCGITNGLTGHPDTGNVLRRTTNAQAGAGSVTWSTVSNVAEVLCIGFGKAQSGGYPAVYIFGWVDQGSGYQLGVYRSDDSCSSWTKLATWPERTDLPGAGGWLDQPRTLVGNPDRWNSCMIGCPGTSLSYYGPSGTY